MRKYNLSLNPKMQTPCLIRLLPSDSKFDLTLITLAAQGCAVLYIAENPAVARWSTSTLEEATHVESQPDRWNSFNSSVADYLRQIGGGPVELPHVSEIRERADWRRDLLSVHDDSNPVADEFCGHRLHLTDLWIADHYFG